MPPNLRTVLVVTLLFGVASGIYEYALPLLLKAWGISLPHIGLIFAVSGLAVVAARIYLGGLADRWGRKLVYGAALGVCGAATMVSPLGPSLLFQMVLKTIRDTAALTRETLHPVILYEAGREVFLNRIGKFRGIEYLLQAGGTGAMMLWFIFHQAATAQTFMLLLYLAGALLLVGTVIWIGAFHEPRAHTEQRHFSLRELLNFDLHPNLLLIGISGIIFAFGLQLSHSFYMVLFFKERFAASESVTALIMFIHRLTLALPLLIVGNLKLKNLKAWYIGGLALQGTVMAVSAVLPTLTASATVFLLHDFIGAGLWLPIQATLIQQYSRDATRGLEVGKVTAWGGIGAIFGPLAAGYLGQANTILPFLFSGIFVLLAALPLCWLRLRKEPAPVPETAAAG